MEDHRKNQLLLRNLCSPTHSCTVLWDRQSVTRQHCACQSFDFVL